MNVGKIAYAPDYGRLHWDSIARKYVEHDTMPQTTFAPLEQVLPDIVRQEDPALASRMAVDVDLTGVRWAAPANVNDPRSGDFERFSESFRYEPDTGKIVRLDGDRPGVVKTKYPNGYIRVNFDGRGYLGHRVAWLLVTGEWPAEEIDHDNLIKDDNRWSNLREACHSSNMGNRTAYSNNKSGLKGASFNKRLGRWQAFIQKDKHHKYLGLFDTAEEAHDAYVVAANENFGEFARAV